MSHLRWTSFRDIEDVLNRYNRVFGLQQQTQQGADWTPAVDILESDTEYLIQAELAAVPKESVKVSVNERVLNIAGERRQENADNAFRQRRSERAYGAFSRSFTLPEDADEGAIRAAYKDGVLSLHVPKVAKPQPRAIEVQIH